MRRVNGSLLKKTEIRYKKLFELQQKIKWYYLFLR